MNLALLPLHSKSLPANKKTRYFSSLLALLVVVTLILYFRSPDEPEPRESSDVFKTDPNVAFETHKSLEGFDIKGNITELEPLLINIPISVLSTISPMTIGVSSSKLSPNSIASFATIPKYHSLQDLIEKKESVLKEGNSCQQMYDRFIIPVITGVRSQLEYPRYHWLPKSRRRFQRDICVLVELLENQTSHKKYGRWK